MGGCQLHLRHSGVLVYREIFCHLIMLHKFIRRPVVLCAVHQTLLKCGIHLTVGDLEWYGSQCFHHICHQAGFLYTDPHALQVLQAGDLLFRCIKASHTRIIPGQPCQIFPVCHFQKPVPDLPIQNLPHMPGILIQIGHFQDIHLRDQLRKLGKRDPGKVYPSILELL